MGPDNGLVPDRRQAIIWTNAVMVLIRPKIEEIEMNISISLFHDATIMLREVT